MIWIPQMGYDYQKRMQQENCKHESDYNNWGTDGDKWWNICKKCGAKFYIKSP